MSTSTHGVALSLCQAGFCFQPGVGGGVTERGPLHSPKGRLRKWNVLRDGNRSMAKNLSSSSESPP